jgi:hypothetical protein
MMINDDRSDQRSSGSWLTRLLRRLWGGGGNRNKGVRIGDRFGKVAELFDGTRTTWRVWGTVDFVDMPHVKMIQEEPPHRIVTVSLSTLLDKRYYRRLAPATEDLWTDPRTDPPVMPEPTATVGETRGSFSVHDRPDPTPPPEKPEKSGSDEDVIRFLELESRTGVAKTNPFSKARSGKRRTDDKASGVTH